jgi:peptidoglycan/LPS O-acetylase OafA/YrhL
MRAASVDDSNGYRPDIDGLRAVAVASVVAFHAGLRGIAGGFVGVDVFFVISGYLIGGHIFSDVRQQRFGFAAFYARRTRRILPALFVMLLVSYLAGLFLLTPLELKELGKEAAPTVFGLSNLLFYTGGGYFAPTAEHDPLLMTWSLGVEEQFYLLFPIVMLALSRLRARTELAALLILSLFSFAGSLWMMRVDPTGAFYLLPPRAWELGVGAALAVWERRGAGRVLEGSVGEIAGLLGAASIVVALVAYRPDYAFPGWFVLLPTLGTVLMLAARGAAINRRVLSWPPVVFAGRVSYSWYLWHWPVFFLHRIVGGTADPWILIALSFVLAVISWRFVETPFRRRVLPPRTLLPRYGGAAVLLAAPAIAFYASGGLPSRLSADGRAFALQASAARANPCLAPYGAAAPVGMGRCVPPLAPGTARLVLLGDSHGSALSAGIADLARTTGLGFGEMTRSSCLPLLGYARVLPDRAAEWSRCLAYQDRAFAYVAAHPEVRVVALGGYWPTGLTLTDARGEQAPLAVALAQTIGRLRALNKQVILVQDVPVYRFDPYDRVVGGAMPLRARLTTALGGVAGDGERGGYGDIDADPARPIVASAARTDPAVHLIDPRATLCDRRGCRYRSSTALYYADVQHLTGPGAIAVVRASGLAGPSR